MITRARLCWFVAWLVTSPGCAHRVGTQTTSGALAELERQVEPEPGQRPAETVARRATRGVIDELNEPEQKQGMDAVMTNAADSLRGALTQGLIDDLGEDGQGPLAHSIAALAEQSATRAARGAMAAMLAGCDPDNPNCLDRRVTDLSTRAAVAFVDGVKRSLGFVALATAFLAGAATVLVLGALWRLARRWRDRSGTPPHPQRRGESAVARAAFDRSRTSQSTSS